MTRKYFGTDGIRGTANIAPITPDIILRLALAAGRRFRRGDHRHKVVIGKDTRLSGYMLEPALTAGFTAMGMDVFLLGPVPTPAVAMLTRSLRADIGVMVSASHNPYNDNGIKLFGPDGYKLSDEEELTIEKYMDDPQFELIEPSQLGRAMRLDGANGRYVEFVKQTFPKGMRLDGIKIVVDCANGAAYKAAPKVFYELGADVTAINVTPNGININEQCGATSPEELCKKVVEISADIGIALDGDADRLIVSDECGNIINGDQIMAVIAEMHHKTGRLKGPLVATIMSNLGLERHLNKLGIGMKRSNIGDRYVVEDMRANGYNLGGEQSGHIILSDYGTTGDGIVAALQVLSLLVKDDILMSELGDRFTPVPQLLKNIKFNKKNGDPLDNINVKQAISNAENKLAKNGRLLIRKSGTEPLIRVMAEGDDEALVHKMVDNIIGAINLHI